MRQQTDNNPSERQPLAKTAIDWRSSVCYFVVRGDVHRLPAPVLPAEIGSSSSSRGDLPRMCVVLLSLLTFACSLHCC